MTRSCITWEDKIEKLGQKHGRRIAETKRISKDRSNWQIWIEKGYQDAWKGKRPLKKKKKKKNKKEEAGDTGKQSFKNKQTSQFNCMF